MKWRRRGPTPAGSQAAKRPQEVQNLQELSVDVQSIRPISCLDVYLKSKNLRTEAESSVSTKYLLVSDGRSDKTSDMRTSTLSCSRTLQDKKLEVEVRTVCGDSQKRKLKLKLRIFSSCRPTADWRGWIWVLDYNNLNFSPLDSNKLQDFCSFSGDQDWLILH